METGIFSFGVFVTILLICGFLYTMIEFRKMSDNPEKYRDSDTINNKK